MRKTFFNRIPEQEKNLEKRLVFKMEAREDQETTRQFERPERPEVRERNGRNRVKDSFRSSEESFSRVKDENEKMKLRLERDEALKEVQKLRDEMQRRMNHSFQKGKKSERWGNRFAWLRKNTVGRVEDIFELNYSAKDKLFKKVFKKKKNESWKEYANNWLYSRKTNQEKLRTQNETIRVMKGLWKGKEEREKREKESQFSGILGKNISTLKKVRMNKKTQNAIDKLKVFNAVKKESKIESIAELQKKRAAILKNNKAA